MIRNLLSNLFGGNHFYTKDLERLETDGEIEEFYTELQLDVLDVVRAETEGMVVQADIWEIAIQEGLFQNLTENPAVAFEFLLISAHGPSIEYMEYIDLASDHQEVVCLLALSALVNDAIYRERKSIKGVNETETITALGDVSKLDYEAKRTQLNQLLDVERDIPAIEFITAKAAHSTSAKGLFDRPLVDLLTTDENLHFYFKAEKYGYTLADGSEINPTGNGAAYQLITDSRVMSAVGREEDTDKFLSISNSAIEDVGIHTGWMKDRIEIETESQKNSSTFSIWVPGIQTHYTKSDILTHLDKS